MFQLYTAHWYILTIFHPATSKMFLIQLILITIRSDFCMRLHCLVHVIWKECRMSKLVLNVKDLLLLSFLTVAEFYNLGHIQGIIRVHQLKRDHF